MNNIWSSSNFKEIFPDCISTYSQSLLPWLFNSAIESQYKHYGFHICDSMMPMVKVFNRKPYFNMSTLQLLMQHCWMQDGESIVKAMGGSCDLDVSERFNAAEGLGNKIKLTIRTFKALVFGYTSAKGVSKEWIDLEKVDWDDKEKKKKIPHKQILAELEIEISECLQRHLMLGVLATAFVDIAIKNSKKHHPKNSYNQSKLMLRATDNAPNIQQQKDFYELVCIFAEREESPSRCNNKLQAKINQFLAKYGHRCIYEMEIAQKRPSEEPEKLLHEIEAAYVAGVHNRIKKDINIKKDSGLLKRSLIQSLVAHIACHLLASREKSKFLLTRNIYRLRKELLSIGNAGKIPGLMQPEDIFMLTREEIYKLLDNVIPDARVLISARKTYTQPFMPDTFRGERPDEYSAFSNPKYRSQGTPVSSGRVSGKATILETPNDIHKLKGGDIAIVKALDSCWNALYEIAGGVLTEVGGMMSHAAIMVREQQIPAIFNISNLFDVICDGDEIEIDCEKGIFTIKNKDS